MEDKITWISAKTGAKMLDYSYGGFRRVCVGKEIRLRVVQEGCVHRLQCCLEDVEEARRRLKGEKCGADSWVARSVSQKNSRVDEAVKKSKVVGPPEWTYSWSRDWTEYTYAVEARVRRTMKPQW